MKVIDGIKYLSQVEFLSIGEALYGETAREWKFQCPNCGNIQRGVDFQELKDLKIVSQDFAIKKYVYFSCIGRYDSRIENVGTLGDGIKPCDYTNGGLFCIAKARIWIDNETDSRSSSVPIFDFADDYSKLVRLEGSD